MVELWRDVNGYEGKYMVSNLGRVKAINYKRRGIEKVLSPVPNTYGYYQVYLYNNGKRKTYTVHRLVAEAFIPNPGDLPSINHKSSKTDNSVDNLEWCTVKYNNNYGIRKTGGGTPKPVYQYTLSGELVKEWDSVCSVERDTGFSNPSISRACRGIKNTYKGYVWTYEKVV